MNNFSIVVKTWAAADVNEEANKFIEECNKKGDVIKDINTHVNVLHSANKAYTFIFKVEEKAKMTKKGEDMERKIIQIIPAPADLTTVYQDCETGELMKSRTLCLALTDEGEVHLMDIDDSGWIEVAETATNFKGIEWGRPLV
ncbi:hypothetical protein FOA24_37375 [Bacillus thuringiensis]|uniref:hypothetical protein n=1 Tax=Bacillus thuringiensis TaxID=1428 RepID=UPI0033361D0E